MWIRDIIEKLLYLLEASKWRNLPLWTRILFSTSHFTHFCLSKLVTHDVIDLATSKTNSLSLDAHSDENPTNLQHNANIIRFMLWCHQMQPWCPTNHVYIISLSHYGRVKSNRDVTSSREFHARTRDSFYANVSWGDDDCLFRSRLRKLPCSDKELKLIDSTRFHHKVVGDYEVGAYYMLQRTIEHQCWLETDTHST